MSLKEISELLKDLIESQKQLTLRLKMIEIEISYIKENLPGKITNMVEKTEKLDKRISQKYIKDLLNKKAASTSTYQKGSMDEILIQNFLEKQKAGIKTNLFISYYNSYIHTIGAYTNYSRHNKKYFSLAGEVLLTLTKLHILKVPKIL